VLHHYKQGWVTRVFWSIHKFKIFQNTCPNVKHQFVDFQDIKVKDPKKLAL